MEKKIFLNGYLGLELFQLISEGRFSASTKNEVHN
jgi:hypothetical protein